MSKTFSLVDALASLCSNTEWSIYGNDYDRIVWHKPGYVPPTKEALEAEVFRLQAEYDAAEYQRMRSPEYPPLQDLADALYWQAQGNNEPMSRYLEACAAVKNKYPKGDTNA